MLSTVGDHGALDPTDVVSEAGDHRADVSYVLEHGRLLGRYRLERELGVGGMGAVWEAHDTELDRRVALKVLKPGRARARLIREGRAMARLRHPNVLTIFDADTLSGLDVIVMELIDGESLASWLPTPRHHDAIVTALLCAGRGLAAAHAAGIVHRDFKPHNVLVDGRGRVVVTDFGLARAISDPDSTLDDTGSGEATMDGALESPMTMTGTILGTPAYMAPEQMTGNVASDRADQFAFCITLWEALAGRRPFPGRSLPEIAASLTDGAPHEPERVPRRLRRVLLRGISRLPGERWPSMDVLLAAIERAWRRPRRIAIALAIGSGLALLAVVALTRGAGDWRPQVIDLPAFEENSDGAAFSPDGTQIAYASDRDRAHSFRIYIGAPDAPEPRAITPVGESYKSPRWKRDGKAVLAVRWDAPTSAWRVAEVPLDGGAPIDLGTGIGVDDCGDALAIADVHDRSAQLVLRRSDGSREVATSTTSDAIRTPRCDRSGELVAFVRGKTTSSDQPGNDVFVVDRQHRETRLATGHRTSSAVFAPDGRSVVYSRIEAGKIELREVSTTGDGKRVLTNEGGPYLAADIAPDGRTLIYDRVEAARIVVAGDGVRSRRLTARREALQAMVPTADRATLVAERRNERVLEVVAISTRDGSERKLADGAQPFMSADGSAVLFSRGRVLAQVALAGGPTTTVCDLPAPLVAGTAGPSGIHLELQRDGVPEWWRVVAGGKLEREDAAGLVFEAPHGGARAVRTLDHYYHFELGGHDFVSEAPLPTWLDEHRFAYARAGAFHVVDAATGAELGVVPGPEDVALAFLAPDGEHWYQLEELAHVTRHLVVNFGERPGAS